jgi:hypothetical protein
VKKLCALFAFVVVAGCGPSAESVCKDSTAATCERMYTCNAVVKVGSDAASCTSQLGALCSLAGASASYDLAAAQKCTADLKAQTCAQYNAGQPASCNK